MSQYKTGTVTTNGTATITGSGTAWLSEVNVGDYFIVRYVQGSIEDGGIAYEIGGVVSDTELTLTAPYGGADVVAADYVVHRDFNPNGLPKIFPTDLETAAIFNKAMLLIGNRTVQGTESNRGTLKVSTLAAAIAGTNENTAMAPDLVHAAVPYAAVESAGSTKSLQLALDEKMIYRDLFNDFVISGGLPATSVNLTTDTPATSAYVSGSRVSAALDSHTYTASSDTYVDLSKSGTFLYTEVANGAAEPAIPADHIRLAKVVTDVDNITGVTDLRVMGSEFKDAFKVTTETGTQKLSDAINARVIGSLSESGTIHKMTLLGGVVALEEV